jgi:hypothetical protein
MIKRLWCFVWGHDWRTISVKEARLRGGAYAIISVAECAKWVERSKRVEPLESLKD